MYEVNEQSKFIFIPFPTNQGSATRMAVLKDVVDGRVENTAFLDADFWELSFRKKVEAICKCMEREKNNFLIFIPSYKAPSYMPQSLITELMHLKNPPAAIIWYLIDSIDRQALGRKITGEEYVRYGHFFDAIYTFDYYDSHRYHIPFIQRPMVTFPQERKVKSKAKVFFIGKDKGRLDKLIQIGGYLKKNDIDYEFLIYREKIHAESKDIDGIHFMDHYLKYDEMIKKMTECTCILSLAAENSHMLPLSYEESIVYNKKLITDCDFLNRLPLHNLEYQRRFETVEDIDVEWLKKDNELIDYHYNDEFSVKRFMERVEEDYYSGLLGRVINNNRLAMKTGRDAFAVDLHFAHEGWFHNVKNGQKVSSLNQLESVRITNAPNMNEVRLLVYQDDIGTIESKFDGEICSAGRTGQGKAIRMFKIWQEKRKGKCVYKYKGYIEGEGWTKWLKEGEPCGSENGGRIMGVQIFLMDESLNQL